MDFNNISKSSAKDKIKKISNDKITPLNKSMEMKNSSSNNLPENINDNNNKNNLSIYSFINEMPFENLNNYYDIESSLFLKRIEKLNLKFYWTSECILNQQDIKYPYNKLFLILFKQISLYIEEISRLNKQLKQKIKNEKFFQIKFAKMKEKENEYTLNKQMLKNLQRDNKLLLKNNEKIKNENEKLNKKLANSYKTMVGNNTSINSFYRNKYKDKNLYYETPRFSNTSSIGYDSIITQESIMSKKPNKKIDLDNDRSNKHMLNGSVKNRHKNRSVSNSVETKNNNNNKNKNNNNNNNNKEIINSGINFCNEEIENLEIIEEILKNIKNKNSNNNNFKKEKNNNLDNSNYKTNSNIKINNYLKINKKNKIYPYKVSTKVKKNFH